MKYELIIRKMKRLKKRYCPRDEFYRKWNRLRALLYETEEYQAFLIEVRTRANFRCEVCNKHGRHVHHVVRVYDDPDLASDPDNGMFLCAGCHRKEHSR